MVEPISQRRDLGRLACAALTAALALVLVGCASVTPVGTDSATGLVAPSGQILLPPCPASAACLDGFVVGDTLYGISCHGIEPTAVEDETLARGSRQYDEARAIEGIPPICGWPSGATWRAHLARASPFCTSGTWHKGRRRKPTSRSGANASLSSPFRGTRTQAPTPREIGSDGPRQ